MGDQRITCVDCGQIFTWSEGEQRYYRERGLHPPRRCRDCRGHRRAAEDPGMRGTLPPPETIPIPKELLATADRLSGRASRPTSRTRHRRLSQVALRFGITTFGMAIVIALVLQLAINDVLVAWLLSINLVAFLAYGYDKGVAGSTMMRVPENILLALAIAGGSLGAIAGMRIFHHKTAKADFQFRFMLIVIAHVAIVIAYFSLRR